MANDKKKLIIIEPPDNVTQHEFQAMLKEVEMDKFQILSDIKIRNQALKPSRKDDWDVHVVDAEVSHERKSKRKTR